MSSFKEAAHRLLAKHASMEIVDTFIDKVASVLPVTKRAAFRTLQASLSGGASLSQAIKVAFPRLSGEQRGIFASNLCKCAADDAKMRTPESYTVPAEKGAKLMREKCSSLRGRNDSPLLGTAKDSPMSESTSEFKNNLRQRDISNRMADATAPMQDDFDRPTDSQLKSEADDNALIGRLRSGMADAAAYDRHQAELKQNINNRISSLLSGAKDTASNALSQARAFGDKINILGLGKTPAAQPDAGLAAQPDAASVAPSKDSLLASLGGYASNHPGLTAGLGAGALGLGGLGLYKLLQNRKKKKPLA